MFLLISPLNYKNDKLSVYLIISFYQVLGYFNNEISNYLYIITQSNINNDFFDHDCSTCIVFKY